MRPVLAPNFKPFLLTLSMQDSKYKRELKFDFGAEFYASKRLAI